MQTLGSLWAWSATLVIIFFGFFVQLLLFVVSRPFDPLRKLPGRFFRLMAVFATKLNPFWNFSVVGSPQAPVRPTVVVSNHASNADVFLISNLPWEMKWMGKASLFRVPVFGWSMGLAGDIPVERGTHSSGAKALLKCADWVRRGMPVMMFPEGTRSLDGKMLPFKDGAFRLALETGAEVLPLGVAGTRDALPKHSWKFGRSRGRVVVGEPIPSQGKTLEALKAEVRSAIELLAKKAEAVTQIR
jgi:1-acyl-sn-glycerol-3-phosphate acyltransferase